MNEWLRNKMQEEWDDWHKELPYSPVVNPSFSRGFMAAQKTFRAALLPGFYKIMSDLMRCNYLPSDSIDDYPQKTYSAGRIARMMGAPHERSKEFAKLISTLLDRLK